MHGNEDVTDNYAITTAAGKLTINPAEVTVTAKSEEFTYDGTAHSNAGYDVEGLVGEDALTAVVEGTITFPTESPVANVVKSHEFTKGTAGNYTVSYENGELTMTNASVAITITGASQEWTYDGKDHTNTAVTVTKGELFEGDALVATATGSVTNAADTAEGNNPIAEGYKVMHGDEDVTANYVITPVDGTLTINPKAVTITTGGGSKEYDGTPLTNAEASIEGLVEGESVTLTATGTITEVGSTSNTYSITWDKAKETNYTVTNNLGTLTITKNSSEVTLTAASDEKTYDGKTLMNSTVTVDGLPDGFTYEATAFGGQTSVGKSANVVNDGYKFFDRDNNDRTDNFTNVTKVDGTLKVNPALLTITTGSASKPYDGTPLTNTEVSITGLVNSEIARVTATGTITEVGSEKNTYSISWVTGSASNYTIKEELGTLTITKNSSKVTLTAASDTKVYDGKALTNNAVTAEGLPEGFTVEATASGSQTDAGNSRNAVNDGYKILDPEGNDKTENFTNVTRADGTLTVTPKAVTITTGSGSKEYDGTPLTNAEVNIEGLVEGEGVALTTTGTITEVGSTENTYDITWDKAKAANYTVTDELGTLTITKNSSKVTLTAASDSKTYDGKPLINNAVTAEGLPEGFTVEATASGSQTDAGNSRNAVNDGYKILDPEGNDKTENFTNVTRADGTLTVTPKAVTITTGSGSKEYDGTPLTNAEVNIEGLVEGEGVALTTTGTITEVGSTENTYDITWDKAKAANYTVTDELGTLTITKNSSKVTLTAASDSKTYDGTPLTNNAVTAEGLPEGFTVEATASGSQTKAGSSDNVVGNNYKIFNSEGIDKTANFTNIELVTGTLTVTQKDVTFTANSNSKEYDGTPLTDNGSTNSGLADGDTATVVVKGSQTIVGIVENVITSILIENADGEDVTASYNIERINGKLEVTAKPLTITAGSASKVYDGKALTKDSYTNSDLAEGDRIESVKIEGSQTLVGSSDNVASDVKIVNAEGKDVTGSYAITYAKGTLTVTDGTPDEPVDDNLVVTKSVDGGDYALGQTVTFRVTATNIYANARTITLSEIDGVTLGQSVFENVAAGETVSTTAAYTITEADILNGGFTNTVTAKVGDITKKADATADTEAKNGHISINKVTTSTPAAEGGRYALGETITYSITAVNDGNLTIRNIQVTDELTKDKWTIDSLAPGASKSFTARYTVTEADILAGKVLNVATAKGTSPDPDKPDVPVNPGRKEDPTGSQNPGISVTKTASATSGVTQGSTVTYTITVRNTGNVTLRNINVSDSLVSFSGNTGTIASLAPGATATLTYGYTVTAANVAAGAVVNTATATGRSPNGTTPTASDSVTVGTQSTSGGGIPVPGVVTPADDTPAGGGPGGGGGGAPGVAPAAPAGPVTPAAIDDQPVPEVEPEIDIVDPEPPLAEGTWAVINLICAIVTALGAIVALFRKKEEDDEDDDEQNADKAEGEDEEDDNRGKKMLASKIAGAVAGVAAPIAFILTEDMSLPMAMTDKWTLLMAALLAAQVAAAVLNKKASELDDDDDEAEAAN